MKKLLMFALLCSGLLAGQYITLDQDKIKNAVVRDVNKSQESFFDKERCLNGLDDNCSLYNIDKEKLAKQAIETQKQTLDNDGMQMIINMQKENHPTFDEETIDRHSQGFNLSEKDIEAIKDFGKKIQE